ARDSVVRLVPGHRQTLAAHRDAEVLVEHRLGVGLLRLVGDLHYPAAGDRPVWRDSQRACPQLVRRRPGAVAAPAVAPDDDEPTVRSERDLRMVVLVRDAGRVSGDVGRPAPVNATVSARGDENARLAAALVRPGEREVLGPARGWVSGERADCLRFFG